MSRDPEVTTVARTTVDRWGPGGGSGGPTVPSGVLDRGSSRCSGRVLTFVGPPLTGGPAGGCTGGGPTWVNSEMPSWPNLGGDTWPSNDWCQMYSDDGFMDQSEGARGMALCQYEVLSRQ
ncbi:hypothetical protein Tco_0678777 [Tanacetum coccineum]|uniref:Uncharacterized protein n=1 Tax=Tanacetum coccineum TaxID=301880 RepID=A0ABQ4XG11_9ASTR